MCADRILCSQILHKELIPYLIKCFHRLYPNKSSSSTFLDAVYFEEILRESGLLFQAATSETEEAKADI